MLQVIRDRFTGGFAIAILALIGVPFMFFGINYNFIGQGYAAKVDGEEISIAAFENAYRSELARYTEQGVEIPTEFRSVIRESVLDSLVRRMLVDNYVDEAGFRIDDKLLTDFIQLNPSFSGDNGQFSKERYYQTLDMNALDPKQFEENQRISLRQSQLQRGIAASAFVTPSEYRRYLNLYGEQRQVTVAEIDVSALTETIEVSDDDVSAYYDARPAGYMSSELVSLDYVEIRRDDLGARAEVTEEEIVAYYEDSSDRYQQDERRQARHVLILFEDDEAAAENQAVELTARLQAGEPFDDIARQYSKDGGTSARGGDLGMLLQSQYPAAIGDAVFSMEEGDITGPVKSEFGFHIVRLDGIESGGTSALDQVRAEITNDLRAQKAVVIFGELENSLADALFDADDMQAIADTVDIYLRNATGFTRAGGEPFGANQAMIDAVFDDRNLIDRDISDIIELDANRSVVFQVSEHAEASRKPLDEVRNEIVAAIRSERAAAMASEQASQLEVALYAGADLNAAAAELSNVQVSEVLIGRQDAEIDPAIGAAVFQTRKPQTAMPRVGSVVTQLGNYAVYSVTAYAPGRPESIPLADRDAGKLRLGSQSGAADYAALVAELERHADIVKSEDILAQQSLFE